MWVPKSHPRPLPGTFCQTGLIANWSVALSFLSRLRPHTATPSRLQGLTTPTWPSKSSCSAMRWRAAAPSGATALRPPDRVILAGFGRLIYRAKFDRFFVPGVGRGERVAEMARDVSDSSPPGSERANAFTTPPTRREAFCLMADPLLPPIPSYPLERPELARMASLATVVFPFPMRNVRLSR
jgi:hypothetical protein